mgnify:FL=1
MKKSLAAVLILSLLLGMAACGNAAPATPGASESQIASSTASASAQAVASESTEKKDVSLSLVGNWWADGSYEKMKADDINKTQVTIAGRELIEKNHPDWKIQFMDWGWAEVLDQKQRVTLLSGNAPDIVHGEVFMPTYANNDMLVPLPQDIVDMVNPNFTLKNAQGEPVAVAPAGTVFMLFYNKDLIKAAGIDPETMQLKTWDDWEKVSDAVTAYGGGNVWGGGIPTHPHAGGSLRMLPFVRQMGADFGGGLKATINTPEMNKALTYIREMDANFPKGAGNNADANILVNMFKTDKNLAFVVDGSWDMRYSEVNLGFTNLPTPADGKEGNCLVAFDYMAVPKLSKNRDEAFACIKDLLSKDIAKVYSKTNFMPVANKEALEDAELNAVPQLKFLYDMMKNGSYKGLPVFDKNDTQVWEVINTKVIARATMTTDPIDVILSEAQAECDKLLQ